MTTGRALMMREPALAMLMGALPQGDNFGFGNEYEYAYGEEVEYEYAYGEEGDYDYGFGLASSYDPSMNMGLPGYGYGYGWGATPTAPAAPPKPVVARPPIRKIVRKLPAPPRPMAVARPNPAAAARAWDLANPASTHHRSMLLDPNRDSTVKVERYSFSFSPAANLVLGTASAIPTFTQNPSTSIKGQRVIMNAPMAGFVLVSSLQVANVNVFVGGVEDAFAYSPLAVGVMLDLPRLDPQNRATAAGAYTGVLPPGYTAGNAFQFVITLQGPATLAGGYGQ